MIAPPRVSVVVGRDVRFDLTKILPRLLERFLRHVKVLLLRARQCMRDVDTEVRPRLIGTLPETKAAIIVLHTLQTFEVTRNCCFDL